MAPRPQPHQHPPDPRPTGIALSRPVVTCPHEIGSLVATSHQRNVKHALIHPSRGRLPVFPLCRVPGLRHTLFPPDTKKAHRKIHVFRYAPPPPRVRGMEHFFCS